MNTANILLTIWTKKLIIKLKKLKAMIASMTHEDLITEYALDKIKLYALYDCIITFLKEKGVTVYFKKLDDIIEVDIYKVDMSFNDDKHHESCLSDGMDVWLHDQMEDIGGITGRLYDILHVGCGHLFQWSAGEEAVNGLKFSGEKAWTIGSTLYLGEPEERITNEVWPYEEEADSLALGNLEAILRINNFDRKFSESCIRLFTDYANTDLEYITSYYKTRKVKNFFEKWQLNSPPLPKINIDFPLHIQRRTNKCIQLLGLRSK